MFSLDLLDLGVHLACRSLIILRDFNRERRVVFRFENVDQDG